MLSGAPNTLFSLHIYLFYVPILQDHVLTLVPHANLRGKVGVLMHGSFESCRRQFFRRLLPGGSTKRACTPTQLRKACTQCTFTGQSPHKIPAALPSVAASGTVSLATTLPARAGHPPQPHTVVPTLGLLRTGGCEPSFGITTAGCLRRVAA
jgi:hypothetical protein